MKIIDIKDRFARGMVAGLISSLVLYGLNIFSYHVLNLTHRRYYNFASVLIFGRKAENLSEVIISSMAQIGFATGLLIIYAYIIPRINSKNIFWKGLFLGAGSWFVIMTIEFALRTKQVLAIDAPSAISMLITSNIWGILGAWILFILDARFDQMGETKSEHVANKTIKFRRYLLLPSPARKMNEQKIVDGRIFNFILRKNKK